MEDRVVGELVAAGGERPPLRQPLRERLGVSGDEEGAFETGRVEVGHRVVEVRVHAVVVGEDDGGLRAVRPREGTRRIGGGSGNR